MSERQTEQIRAMSDADRRRELESRGWRFRLYQNGVWEVLNPERTGGGSSADVETLIEMAERIQAERDAK